MIEALIRQSARRALHSVLDQLRSTENFGPLLLAVVVGLAGGAGAVVFRWLIAGAQHIFFDCGKQALWFMGKYHVIVAPLVGLVIVSVIVRKFATEARGHGVPEVMFAERDLGGRIRPRVAVVKALASALCIGSGGSVGREGPIVQIGSSVGSTLGQVLKLKTSEVRLLVACGAAAGIAGTFNAPLAGAIFAHEVILGSLKRRALALVVVASVTGTALSQWALGKAPSFQLPHPFSQKSPWEILLYAVMGLALGFVAVAYVRTLYFLEGLFERWRLHDDIKAAFGGLLVGILGYFIPDLFGVGYSGVEKALRGELVLSVLLLMAALKILATSLTLAAGGSGGVFAPSLLIGATAGGAFGQLVNMLFPGITAPAGAYSLVGMAAVFAGAAHAPITSIIILFEMTDDYKIILPLMTGVVISYLVAVNLSPQSIYTIKLRRLQERHAAQLAEEELARRVAEEEEKVSATAADPPTCED